MKGDCIKFTVMPDRSLSRHRTTPYPIDDCIGAFTTPGSDRRLACHVFVITANDKKP